MKNIKGFLLATMTMLFLGMGNVNAQEQKSILIKVYHSGRTAKIFTVMSDYQVTEVDIDAKDEKEFLIAIKKELDKWLEEGYLISESSISSYDASQYSKFYTLTKKD